MGEVYDPVTEQSVAFPYPPQPPRRGLAEGQTLGCRCSRCADSDDDRPCLLADEDRSCYCQGCVDETADFCMKRGAPACGRCGRRDWAMLDVRSDPPLCGRCRWLIFNHEGQSRIESWAGGAS